jgi:NAD(P)-dependent dehydrogenase (short-subunit alcohol dehydrogenase family)
VSQTATELVQHRRRLPPGFAVATPGTPHRRQRRRLRRVHGNVGYRVSHFHLLLNLEGKKAVVIGGGAVGERKVRALAECGADVTVVAPRLTVGLNKLAAAGQILHEDRPYRPGDLDGAAAASRGRRNGPFELRPRPAHTTPGRADLAVVPTARDLSGRAGRLSGDGSLTSLHRNCYHEAATCTAHVRFRDGSRRIRQAPRQPRRRGVRRALAIFDGHGGRPAWSGGHT